MGILAQMGIPGVPPRKGQFLPTPWTEEAAKLVKASLCSDRALPRTEGKRTEQPSARKAETNPDTPDQHQLEGETHLGEQQGWRPGIEQ